MELSWTTFFFEIINFLVLLWILKRFLYRPLLKVLDERRTSIDKSLADAQNLQQQATTLEQKYQSRLDDWELEKQKLLTQLQQELQIEREQKREQLELQLKDEREKAAVIDHRQQAETIKHYQQSAHQQGAKFASRLLSSVAGPELEKRLFELFLTSIDRLAEDQSKTLNSTCEAIQQVTVCSAYELSSSQHELISTKLNALCGKTLEITFLQDPDLLAGLRICIGDWVLRFNLQDELNSFSELGHENPIS